VNQCDGVVSDELMQEKEEAIEIVSSDVEVTNCSITMTPVKIDVFFYYLNDVESRHTLHKYQLQISTAGVTLLSTTGKVVQATMEQVNNQRIEVYFE
jgi:hypothetical protein